MRINDAIRDENGKSGVSDENKIHTAVIDRHIMFIQRGRSVRQVRNS